MPPPARLCIVVNGNAYLRTPVKARRTFSADYVEITEGVYAGDVVVADARRPALARRNSA
jgi:hypothetical protein